MRGDIEGTPDSEWGNPELPEGADDGPTLRDNPAVPHPGATQHAPAVQQAGSVDVEPDADDRAHIANY